MSVLVTDAVGFVGTHPSLALKKVFGFVGYFGEEYRVSRKKKGPAKYRILNLGNTSPVTGAEFGGDIGEAFEGEGEEEVCGYAGKR
ncbi:hypothetical protein LINPERPRIM_LOCUS2225 [Linum perenne]